MEQLLDSRTLSSITTGDCNTLLQFLLAASKQKLLSGRMLIDLTRLGERIVVVDVEVLRKKNAYGQLVNEHFVLTSGAASDAAGEIKHIHHKDRLGKGRSFTRTYVLTDQVKYY